MKTVEDIRVERLQWLMRQRGYNTQALADAIERSHSQVSQLLGRARHSKTGRPRVIGPRLARAIESKLDVPIGILDTPLVQDHTFPGGTTEAETYPGLNNITVPRQPLTWRDLYVMELPEVFEALLPDDAMAPDLPKGRRVEFDRRELPEFGDKVLVRDRLGTFHFRLYSQVTEAPWEAHATNAAYLSLQPERDGAAIVAVMTGHFVPRRTRV